MQRSASSSRSGTRVSRLVGSHRRRTRTMGLSTTTSVRWELLVRVLERFTDRLIGGSGRCRGSGAVLPRQVAASDALPRRRPRVSKVWYELQALAGTVPAAREGGTRRREWRAVLREAFAEPRERYGLEIPLKRWSRWWSRSTRGSSSSGFGNRDGSGGTARVDRAVAGGEGMTAAVDVTTVRPANRHAPAIRTRRGTSSGTASGPLRGLRHGEPTVLLMPTWSIIHSRHWKMQIPSSLATAACSRSTDAATGAPTGRPSPTPTVRGVRRGRDRGDGRNRDRPRGRRVAVAGRGTVAAARGGTSGAGRQDGVHRPGAPAATGDPAPAGDARVRRAARGLHRLGEVEPSLLGRALRGLPRVLLLAVLHGAALDQAARGCRRLGSRHRRRDVGRDSAGAAANGRGERARAPLPDRLSDPRDPRERRRHTPLGIGRAAGGARERGAHGPRGLRPSAPCPRPRQGQPAPPRLHQLRHRRRAAGCAGSRGGSGRSTSRRRSGSATHSATRRSRTSCASSIPTSRSTGSPKIPSRECSRRAASGSIRRVPTSRTSRITSSASPPSTISTASRRSGGWTRSCSRTSWSSTTSSARRSTTSGSGTRHGSSTTTCTRTPSRSARPTSG